MRFYEKLTERRKENNFSQEDLAEKMSVSRQAVSKWETGQSYPDMDKILQMCKLLNCHLEDLLDDGTIGIGESKKKKSVSSVMNSFLGFLTKSSNMVASMKFTQFLKCFFEMAFIALMLVIAGSIFNFAATWFFDEIFGYTTIPILMALRRIILAVCEIGIAIIAVISFLHLFKIRYLDYYITIEDQNTSEKTIEQSKVFETPKRETIVIRDTKHSGSRFFESMFNVVVWCVKGIVAIFALTLAFFFICTLAATAYSLSLLGIGIIALFAAIACVGVSMILYLALEWMYNFIVSRPIAYKRIFILAIASLGLIAIGTALTCATYMSFDAKTDFAKEEYTTKEFRLSSTKNIIVDHSYGQEKKVIDNDVKGVIFKVKYVTNLGEPYMTTWEGPWKYTYRNLQLTENPLGIYKFILNDIKNKTARSFDLYENTEVVKYMSKETQKELQNNLKKARIYEKRMNEE